eukprot:6176310-Pleurochrysis_carterae.AAC.1
MLTARALFEADRAERAVLRIMRHFCLMVETVASTSSDGLAASRIDDRLKHALEQSISSPPNAPGTPSTPGIPGRGDDSSLMGRAPSSMQADTLGAARSSPRRACKPPRSVLRFFTLADGTLGCADGTPLTDSCVAQRMRTLAMQSPFANAKVSRTATANTRLASKDGGGEARAGVHV